MPRYLKNYGAEAGVLDWDHLIDGSKLLAYVHEMSDSDTSTYVMCTYITAFEWGVRYYESVNGNYFVNLFTEWYRKAISDQ